MATKKERAAEARLQTEIVKKEVKKAAIKVYIIAIIISTVVSLAVTFQSKWVPAAKDLMDKAVDVVTIQKPTESE